MRAFKPFLRHKLTRLKVFYCLVSTKIIIDFISFGIINLKCHLNISLTSNHPQKNFNCILFWADKTLRPKQYLIMYAYLSRVTWVEVWCCGDLGVSTLVLILARVCWAVTSPESDPRDCIPSLLVMIPFYTYKSIPYRSAPG